MPCGSVIGPSAGRFVGGTTFPESPGVTTLPESAGTTLPESAGVVVFEESVLVRDSPGWGVFGLLMSGAELSSLQAASAIKVAIPKIPNFGPKFLNCIKPLFFVFLIKIDLEGPYIMGKIIYRIYKCIKCFYAT